VCSSDLAASKAAERIRMIVKFFIQALPYLSVIIMTLMAFSIDSCLKNL
jgi:hypothetical protein